MPDRALTPSDDLALRRLRQDQQGSGDFFGPVLSVTFAVSGATRDIQHGLGVIPDGYEIVFADGEVHAVPGLLWTSTMAYLQASANNVHAILRFRVLRQSASPA